MPQVTSLSSGLSITGANYALVAAAVIYLFDFVLTVGAEVQTLQLIFAQGRGPGPWRRFSQLFALRYLPLLYQVAILSGVSFFQFTPQSCRILDDVVLSIDSGFQFAYVAIISWRVNTIVFRNWPITLAMASVSFASTLINIIVSNPSLFPTCRVINPSHAPDQVLLVPCLRATFDALACIALLVHFGRFKPLISGLDVNFHKLLSELVREEAQDLILIFVIMTVEAVFVQMPAVRAHARNYIAPFVDSLTALLATRFLMKMNRPRHEDHDKASIVSTPPSIASPRPSMGSSVHAEESWSSPDNDLSALFRPWPPETLELERNTGGRLDCEAAMDWPSEQNDSRSSLDAGGSMMYPGWPPETFDFDNFPSLFDCNTHADLPPETLTQQVPAAQICDEEQAEDEIFDFSCPRCIRCNSALDRATGRRRKSPR
ncbi:hypothetical protein B0H16DRAFT_1702018 [Mycena metata]|uniref:Uncharacterized protein n=1 Tax=Mycena metata TaxID=1033252 RepID=A0AAD7H8C5_9AGAR|nr:hypothetical protein B0H16DRAFT_1702018 [Mycena metata]